MGLKWRGKYFPGKTNEHPYLPSPVDCLQEIENAEPFDGTGHLLPLSMAVSARKNGR
jgi:hypothetical protein